MKIDTKEFIIQLGKALQEKYILEPIRIEIDRFIITIQLTQSIKFNVSHEWCLLEPLESTEEAVEVIVHDFEERLKVTQLKYGLK